MTRDCRAIALRLAIFAPKGGKIKSYQKRLTDIKYSDIL